MGDISYFIELLGNIGRIQGLYNPDSAGGEKAYSQIVVVEMVEFFKAYYIATPNLSK